MALQELLSKAPHAGKLVDSVIAVWPQHRHFAERHFASCDSAQIEFLEILATRLLALVGDDLPRHAEDYKWMCGFFMNYELQARRNKGLEFSDFDSIRKHYYESDVQMGRYMRGLMVSQVLWRQHAGAASFFAKSFLPALKDGYDYLEIGPGHGLWMSFAASDPRCKSLCGWDVAEASLAMTREGLAKIGLSRPVEIELQDVCGSAQPQERFDAVVISQVLELVSSPELAVKNLAAALRPGGLLFVNCPTKMLAPDHIRVWSGFEEVDGLFASAGLIKVASDQITPDAKASPEKQGYSYVAYARKP